MYDLTFSAPKSVSIQALFGGDERLVATHVKAAPDRGAHDTRMGFANSRVFSCLSYGLICRKMEI
ncbi:MAG: relaxase domain-containing protein [Acidobacteriaceae bacterium]